MDIFHDAFTPSLFATVILPLAVPKPYTYYIPQELKDAVQFGVRVEVQIKNSLLSGLVVSIHTEKPEYETKPILSVVDEQPVVVAQQIELWRWMAAYYCSTLGEVMIAALPAYLKLSSETKVTLNPAYPNALTDLEDEEYLVAEALTLQPELSIENIRQILHRKTVYPLINVLLAKGVLALNEELVQRYKPKMVNCVRLCEGVDLKKAFADAAKSEKQTNALIALLQLTKTEKTIRCAELYQKAGANLTHLKSLEKKKIVELFEIEVSRMGSYGLDLILASELAPQQETALKDIERLLTEKDVVLLHGVTGSGKTRVYTECIQNALARGEQVLYLLPEIALTTHIISRLQKIFGDAIAVFHSRLSDHERVEVWRSVLKGKQVILGARSSLFLPFRNLGLIIVDEEHDPSFKQQDPGPRYNARDASIFLARVYQAKVILGTATPSVESYHNALTGKYGLVEMAERYGGLQMPEIVIVDLRKEMAQKTMTSNFSSVLIAEMKSALDKNDQAILFQNRRGYSPTLQCGACGVAVECKNCDVTLTYHKFSNALNCHYCGFTRAMPKECAACGSKALTVKGFGTERIEDEIAIALPEAKIDRMDLDTARSKNAFSKIINDFEEGRTNVLVGTQMIAKGLDFEHVGVVGILSADNLLRFPDFRASERAFQLMTQVSGRAGRKHKRGKVVIQAFEATHPALFDIQQNDFQTFFHRELKERREFDYPPFCRLIGLQLKHKDASVLNAASQKFADALKSVLGESVKGPAVPTIGRVNNYFRTDFLIKIEKKAAQMERVKALIAQSIYDLQKSAGYGNVRVNVDVDPY